MTQLIVCDSQWDKAQQLIAKEV